MTERGPATRVVLAPDKFKGSLTAAEVAAALATGIHDERPRLETIQLAVADGRDATVAEPLSPGFEEVAVDAVGPTGERVAEPYALDGDRAGVELAAVGGQEKLP